VGKCRLCEAGEADDARTSVATVRKAGSGSEAELGAMGLISL
jgi:hypothetical protein